jgi:thiol-disulfide isomerase/thioredoxin
MKKIIVISALWCPSCLILNKQLKKMQELYPDLIIQKLDYDFDDDVKNYEIGNILPVVISSGNGKQLVGENSDQELQEFIEGNVVNEK